MPYPLDELLYNATNALLSQIQHDLVVAGFLDVPREGIYLLVAVSQSEACASEHASELGVSRQVANQTFNTLIQRRYLRRLADPLDGRRYVLSLDTRGKLASQIVLATIKRVNRTIATIVGGVPLSSAKTTLEFLAQLK